MVVPRAKGPRRSAIIDIDDMTAEQRAALPRLIRVAVIIADYGLGHDGCPFCGRIVEHKTGCIAVVFGATKGRLGVDDGGPPGGTQPS
jgi:hypothetical protein